MKSLVSLIFTSTIFGILTIQCFAMAKHSDLITTTCKATPYYQLCVSTLRSNPRSSNADIAGLALIMVDVTKAKATAALVHIKKLKGSNPQLKEAISMCSAAYKMILDVDIPEALEALPGNPKFAEDGMSDSIAEAQGCGNSFSRYKSPVTAMNKVVHDLSAVATSIIRMLL